MDYRKAIAIEIAAADGEMKIIPAFATATPGLAVHLALGDPAWVVTHIRSGLEVGAVPTEAAARSFAEALAAAGDWTRSGVEIKYDLDTRRRAIELRGVHGAMPIGRNPHALRDERMGV